jgi:hypothetical protein
MDEINDVHHGEIIIEHECSGKKYLEKINLPPLKAENFMNRKLSLDLGFLNFSSQTVCPPFAKK